MPLHFCLFDFFFKERETTKFGEQGGGRSQEELREVKHDQTVCMAKKIQVKIK